VRVLALVAHGAIIRYIGAPVRVEPEVGRAVERVGIGSDERLIPGSVARKLLDMKRERGVGELVEVDQLDLVAEFWGG
jgi:hypothetical protein